MGTFIRRVLVGFKKDREQRQTTISLYLNLFLIGLRKSLKNLVFFGVVLSVTYWLGFIVYNFSTPISVKFEIWGIYSLQSRTCAAWAALGLLLAALVLYMNRLHTLGKFVETFGDNGAFDSFSQNQYDTVAKLIDAEELMVVEREKMLDQAIKHN